MKSRVYIFATVCLGLFCAFLLPNDKEYGLVESKTLKTLSKYEIQVTDTANLHILLINSRDCQSCFQGVQRLFDCLNEVGQKSCCDNLIILMPEMRKVEWAYFQNNLINYGEIVEKVHFLTTEDFISLFELYQIGVFTSSYINLNQKHKEAKVKHFRKMLNISAYCSKIRN